MRENTDQKNSEYGLFSSSANDLQFKRYIKKCALHRVLILIMASQLLKLVEWFEIRKLSQAQNVTFAKNKNFINSVFDYIYRSYHFLTELSLTFFSGHLFTFMSFKLIFREPFFVP